MFKDYYGNPIMATHTHAPIDTPATRNLISVIGNELLKTAVSDISISYYSQTFTPVVETVSGQPGYIISANNFYSTRGNVAIKLKFSTPLSPSKSYLFMLEPLSDSNAKTMMVNIDFSTATTYDFNKLKYVYEKIARPISGYSNLKYLYKITPKTTINSMIVYLYVEQSSSTSKKQLLKTTVKEISMTPGTIPAIVTNTEAGFMSMEDKNKLEIISTSATYLETILNTAVYYSDDVIDNINQ